MGDELNQMIDRIIPQLQKLWLPIVIIAALIGLTLMITGLVRIGKKSNKIGANNGGGVSADAIMVLVGFILLNTYAALDTICMSTMAQTSMRSLSYMPSEGPGRAYIQLAVYIIQLVGIYGFICGWNRIKDIGYKSDGVFWKGATQIIGGCWAVNIIGFFQALGLSMGGMVQDAIQFTLEG